MFNICKKITKHQTIFKVFGEVLFNHTGVLSTNLYELTFKCNFIFCLAVKAFNHFLKAKI